MDEELKKVLLEVAEDHLMLAIEDVYKVAQVYVDSTETPFDNTALDFLKGLKDHLKALADKVDGEEG